MENVFITHRWDLWRAVVFVASTITDLLHFLSDKSCFVLGSPRFFPITDIISSKGRRSRTRKLRVKVSKETVVLHQG